MVVHPDSNQISRVWLYSGYSQKLYLFQLRDFHPLWLAFPDYSFTNIILTSIRESYNPIDINICGLGSSNFARRYFQNLFWFLFLGLLRWFNSPSFPSTYYLFIYRCMNITSYGFLHSAIDGSILVCSSPSLIAAYHDLHRLIAPAGIPQQPLFAWPYYNILQLFFILITLSYFILFLLLFLIYFYVKELGTSWTWTTDLALIRRAL